MRLAGRPLSDSVHVDDPLRIIKHSLRLPHYRRVLLGVRGSPFILVDTAEGTAVFFSAAGTALDTSMNVQTNFEAIFATVTWS
jgi:hypothetical protein